MYNNWITDMNLAVVNELINKDYIQYGFAFFSLVLIGVIVWLLMKFVKVHDKLINVIEKNNKVLAQFIDEVKLIRSEQHEMRDSIVKFRDEFSEVRIDWAKRPCQAEVARK